MCKTLPDLLPRLQPCAANELLTQDADRNILENMRWGESCHGEKFTAMEIKLVVGQARMLLCVNYPFCLMIKTRSRSALQNASGIGVAAEQNAGSEQSPFHSQRRDGEEQKATKFEDTQATYIVRNRIVRTLWSFSNPHRCDMRDPKRNPVSRRHVQQINPQNIHHRSVYVPLLQRKAFMRSLCSSTSCSCSLHGATAL